IVLSRPYQLTSAGSDPSSSPSPSPGAPGENPRLFARMPVRGLTAEQLYDSVAQAVGLAAEEQAADLLIIGSNWPRGEFLEKFARHAEKSTETQTSILQALALMNGRVVSGATRLEDGATLTAVAEAPFLDTAGRVEALFLATLSRRP